MTYKRPNVDWSGANGNGAPGMENLKTLGHALGGAGVGIGQGLGDMLINTVNYPADIYHYFSGEQPYNISKPNFRKYTPDSDVGRNFEKGGEFLSPLVSPVSLAGIAGVGGKMIPRLIASALGGAAESNPGYRGQGALLGALAPGLGSGVRAAWKTPLLESTAVKKLNKAEKLGEKSGDLGIPMSLDFLRNMEYQMGSKHLSPVKQQLNTLMGDAAKGDYASYKALGSALGDIQRDLTHPSKQAGGIGGMIKNILMPQQTSAAERLTGRQVGNLRQQYITNALEHLNKTGHGKLANLDQEGRDAYRRYMEFKPIRNSLLGAGAATAGIPGWHYLKQFL